MALFQRELAHAGCFGMCTCPGASVSAIHRNSNAVIAALQLIPHTGARRQRQQTMRADIFQRRNTAIGMAQHDDRRIQQPARKRYGATIKFGLEPRHIPSVLQPVHRDLLCIKAGMHFQMQAAAKISACKCLVL